MTRRTRTFVVGSSAVLVTGLGVGFLAYYGGLSGGAFAREAGPEELAYVPADAAVVAYADVHEVMASELRQKLRAVVPPEDQGREEFRQRTGIDIEADLDRVVACVLPREGPESAFVVLRGRFDAARLEALAREHHGVVEEYRGTRIVRGTGGDGGEGEDAGGRGHRGTPAMAFAEPGLVLVGELGAVKAALETRAAGQNVTANDDLMKLIRDMDGSSTAWAVGRVDVLARHGRLPQEVSSQLPAVRWFSAAGRIDGGMSGVIRAEARDEEAARNLRDVANGFLALARLQAGSKPELQALMQSVALGGTGTTVELSFALPSEVIDALGAAARARRGERRGRD
jgi:hypothetical protein